MKQLRLLVTVASSIILLLFAAPALAQGGSAPSGTELTPQALGVEQVHAVSEGAVAAPLSGNQVNACSLSGIKRIGPTGDYASLSAAIADIKTNGLGGALILELQSDYSSAGESFPITINTPCASAANTLTIRPAAGASALAISSASATATIDLDSATYVTFDGQPGGTGEAKELTIENTNTSGVALRFINDASHNTLKFLNVRGVTAAATSGVVLFSTTTGTNGNDNNTIDRSDLGAGASTPPNMIYSAGTSGKENSAVVISNNTIHDFFSATTSTAGINIGGGNTDWTISENQIYQTVGRTFTSTSTFLTYYGININNTGGNNFAISGNVIGYGAADGTGTTTISGSSTGMNNQFRGISLNVGATTASNVQGNTVAGISQTTSRGDTSPINAGFIGILVQSGLVTITDNTVGSMSENSITLNAITTAYQNLVQPEMGIFVYGSSNAALSNNSIGGITVSNAGGGTTVGLVGIRVNTVPAATSTVSHNTVGGMGADSLKVQPLYGQLIGIRMDTSIATLSQNTIRNLTHTGAGAAIGIQVLSPAVATVSQNAIHDMKHTGSGSVVGIWNSSSASAQTISGNTIHSLSNTNATALVSVTGIEYGGPATGTNLVTRNFVHSLSLATSSPSAAITGIQVDTGAATYANNMVRLGIDALGVGVAGNYAMRGIWEKNTGGANSYYFNSVFLGGSQSACASGCTGTSAFQNDYATNTRAVKDNIFVNLRSGAGSHTAVFFRGGALPTASLSSDHNLYLASSITAIRYSNGSTSTNYTLAGWQTASGQDAHSLAPTSIAQVNFVNPTGGAGAVNLHVQSTTAIEGKGTDVGVADDYDGDARSNLTPTDIGADAGNFTAYDATAPVIDLSSAHLPDLFDPALSNVIITDNATGVDIAAGTRPRVYYKRSTDANVVDNNTCRTGGWKFVEADGTGKSPFNFALDYSLLSGCTDLDAETVIQFFVVAQDKATPPNVGIAPASFTTPPPSVALPAGPVPIGGTLGSTPAPSTWLGAVSSDWHNPANWSSVLVPSSQTAAVIPPYTPNAPIVNQVGQTAEAGYLTVKNNAVLTIHPGFVLNVDRRLSHYGEMTGGGTAVIENMDWYAGWLRNVAVTLNGTLGIKGTNYKYAVYGTRLTVATGARVIQEATAGNISAYGTATSPALIENLGTWDLQGNAGLDLDRMANGDTRGTIHNAAGATFKKTGGTGKSRIQGTFDNDGRLELHTGELALEGRDRPDVASDGQFLIKTGSTLVLTQGGSAYGYYVGATGEIADFSPSDHGDVRFEVGNNVVDGRYDISGTTVANADTYSDHTLNRIESLGKIRLPAASKANLALNGPGSSFDQNYDIENLGDSTLSVNFASFRVLGSYTQACRAAGGDLGECALVGEGDFEVWGETRWGGGSIKGTSISDRFVAHGPLSIEANVWHNNVLHYLELRTLVNEQLATVTDGHIRTRSAQIVNPRGAKWDVQCDCDIQQPISNDSVFENDGLLLKSVGSTTDESEYNLVLNNRALVDLRQGVFNFRNSAGGASSGDFAVAVGTKLRLHGDHLISGRVCGNASGVLDCTTASTGSVEIWDSGSTHFSGLYHITGGTTVKGVTDNRTYWDSVPESLGPLTVMDTADAYFTVGPVTTPYDVTVQDGAVLELTFPDQATTFTVNGIYRQLDTSTGTPSRQGQGTLVLAGTGPHMWSDGYWHTGGKTVVNSGVALTIDTATQYAYLWAHTLENHGEVTWSGVYNLQVYSTSTNPMTIDNWGSWDIQTDADMSVGSSLGENTINNWGTFQKTVGADETTIQADFNNKNGGTLTVDAGSIYIRYNDLVNDRGGTVIIGLDRRLGVNNSVTNNGKIQHTRSSTGADNEFALITDNGTPPNVKYHGVIIYDTVGETTVSVWGNQTCTIALNVPRAETTVWRCYELDPPEGYAGPTNAKFYYLKDERNNNNDPYAWHWNAEKEPNLWDIQVRDDGSSSAVGDTDRWVMATGLNAFSPYALADATKPLAVMLGAFSAAQMNDDILLSWDTVSEIDNSGFYLYRSTAPDAPAQRIVGALIPSQAPGGTQGSSYTWQDTDVAPGVTYFYWLEAVDFDGTSQRFGPVSTTMAPSASSPAAVRLTTMSASSGALALPLVWLAVILAVGASLLTARAVFRRGRA